MAINFLNTVDLNFNQLNKAAIQNLATDPAAGVLGQIYYNTAVSALKICVTAQAGAANAVWTEVGATSGVETLTTTQAGDSIGDTLTVLTNAIGNVTINSFAYAGASNIGYVPIGGNGTTFLRGDGTWVVPTDTVYTADKGVVLSGTEFNAAIPATNQTATAAAITNTTGRTYQVQTLTTDAGNLVVNVPWTDTNVVTYTLPVTAGAVSPASPTTGIITLTGSDGNDDIVTFTGTTNRITVAGNAGTSAITVDLTDDVTIVDDLTVGGELTASGTGQSSFAGQVTIPQTPVADTDAASKKFVLDQVAGLGSFQGGYDASTNPGSPALTGASNIAFGQGDFYAVTVAGTITFSDTPTGDATLEVGDFIFANSDITANSNPASTDFTLILADKNIAGAGATDGATPKGVAGFDSANFDVSATGWVQLNSQRNPYGRKQSLNNTAPSSRVVSGGVTTFTIDLANAALFGTGTLSQNVTVEVTDGVAPFETVYAHINRSGSASMTVAFSGTIASDLYQVLLTHV